MQLTPISKVMSTDVISAKKNTPLGKLKSMMEELFVSHIPIIDDTNSLIGIVSKIDILKVFWETASNPKIDGEKAPITSLQADDIMQNDVLRLKENTNILQAIDVLMDKSFHSLPIVNDNNKLIGILTSNDLLLELRKHYE
jgi:CBS domain-containing protein